MSNALPLVAHPDLESQVQALEDDGYVYLPGTLEAEEVAALRDAMDRLEAIEASYDRHTEPENGGFLNIGV